MFESNPIIRDMERTMILPPASGKPGAFRVSNNPSMREPLNAVADPRIRRIHIRACVRWGKTLVIEGIGSYKIRHERGNMAVFSHTNEMAERFAKDRFLKNVRHLDCMRHVWPDTAAANNQKEARLPHMSIPFLGLNASNTQSLMLTTMLVDELHLAEQGMMKFALNRIQDQWDGKAVSFSTASDEGRDEDVAYHEGTQESWHLGCPECKRLVKLTWTNPGVITWATDDGTCPNGERNMLKTLETVRFKCPHEGCAGEFEDNQSVRGEMSRLGGYVVGNPFAPVDSRSFHISQIAAPVVPWGEIVEDWIKAQEQKRKGDISALRVFMITRLAETWKIYRPDDAKELPMGGYNLWDDDGKLIEFQWDEEFTRFLTADRQASGGEHYWYVVRAMSLEGASRLVMAGRLESFPEIEQARIRFGVEPNNVGVDSKYLDRPTKRLCQEFGFWSLRAKESVDGKTASFPHPVKATDGSVMTVQRPYSMVVTTDFPKTVMIEGRQHQVMLPQYSRWFSKAHYRELLNECKNRRGMSWEVPMDVEKLKFQGTHNAKTSYTAQLNSCEKREIFDPKSEKTSVKWHEGNENHLWTCEEMQFVFASFFGISEYNVAVE